MTNKKHEGLTTGPIEASPSGDVLSIRLINSIKFGAKSEETSFTAQDYNVEIDAYPQGYHIHNDQDSVFIPFANVRSVKLALDGKA